MKVESTLTCDSLTESGSTSLPFYKLSTLGLENRGTPLNFISLEIQEGNSIFYGSLSTTNSDNKWTVSLNIRKKRIDLSYEKYTAINKITSISEGAFGGWLGATFNLVT
jgi:hypothetical protein